MIATYITGCDVHTLTSSDFVIKQYILYTTMQIMMVYYAFFIKEDASLTILRILVVMQIAASLVVMLIAASS